MIETLIYSFLPIPAALVLGYLCGMFSSKNITNLASKIIGPLVWLLLLTIGIKFADVFKDPLTAGKTIYLAALFSILSTLFSFLLIHLFFYKYKNRSKKISNKKGKANLLEPLKECAIAFGMVFIGIIIASLPITVNDFLKDIPITDILLYALIFFVGIDIVAVKLKSSWRSFRILIVPILVIAGSLISGVLISFITNESLNTSLVLSSGFGWFTLSGVLVSSKLGAVYGTVALLTDLFRELLAILLLYLFGTNYSTQCIGAGGATTMDSTLPIVKQTCPPETIPLAIVSGFILSITAPILMTFLLSLG